MKTPKEKAAELIDKFTYWNTSESEREGIKSALSCVDEIINYLLDSDWALINNKANYWEQVKNEINNL